MKISRIIATASVFAILALNGGVAHAAASSLYVTPASATVAMGSTFSVSIVENGDNVNVVTVNLSYDASKLSCNGVGGGSFAQTIAASCGGGNVTISRYVTPGQPALNGPQTVGSLSFTAIANNGTAGLNFLGSQVVSGGVNTLASSVGGVYTLTGSTSGNTGGGTNSGNGSTSGSGNTSGATNGTTTTYGPKATAATASNTSGTQSDSNSTATTNNNAQSSGVLSDNQSKDKTTSKDSNNSEQNDTKKETENNSTKRNLLMLVGLIAVATGIVFAQRYRENQALQAQAAALAAKKAKAKKSNKTTKKTTKKKPVARKK